MAILGWLSTKRSSFQDFLQNFRLDTTQKIKLIEILLVISSILTFRLPNNLLEIFLFVILSSVVYWIILQRNQLSYVGETIWATKIVIAGAISGFFAYIVTSLMYLNEANLPLQAFTIGFLTYFITLSILLFIALMPEFIWQSKE
jgi:hypothetical protein